MSKEIYEIERKFLVKEIPNNLQQYKYYKITIIIRRKNELRKM